MRIESVNVKPYENSVTPGIGFEIKISHTKYKEAIISVSGWLATDDGKIITELHELGESRSEAIGAKGSGFDSNFEEGRYMTELVALLNKRALDQIEKRRMKDRIRNVNFVLKLNVKYIESSAVISHLHEENHETIGPITVQTQRSEREGNLIVYAPDPDFSANCRNLWILSGDNNPVFLYLKEQNLKKTETVPSGEWIHDYAPKLELGEYFVVEIPTGKKTSKKAWEYIEKAEECFRSWDTKGVYANCREVGSLLDKILKVAGEKFGAKLRE